MGYGGALTREVMIDHFIPILDEIEDIYRSNEVDYTSQVK